jgi:hypothetical protein
MNKNIKFLRSLMALTIFTLFFTPCFSQSNGCNLDDLIGKRWSYKGIKEDKSYVDVYTRTTHTTTLKDGGSTAIFKLEFYLSDEKDNEFDSSKVGKSKSGKYIIERNIRDNKSKKNVPSEIKILEILEIGPSTLILCPLNAKRQLEFESL